MTDNPASLQDIIISYLATNLTELCTIQYDPKDATNHLVFRDPNAFVHPSNASQLLKIIDLKGELDDLVLTLFDPVVLKLNALTLHNASNLSCLGLKVINGHPLSSVEIWGLASISVNEVISCFGEWTINHIVSLSLHGPLFFNYFSLHHKGEDCDNIPEKEQRHNHDYNKKRSNLFSKSGALNKYSTHADSQEQASASVNHFCRRMCNTNETIPAVDFGICKLKSLQVLNLSDTNVATPTLKNICAQLKNIKMLDISNCNAIDSVSCLLLLKNSLKSLSMYNMDVLNFEETKNVLLELKNLLHLDVSKNKHRLDPLDKIIIYRSVIPELLRNPEFGPNLKAIDISGQEEVSPDDLFIFINTHYSPQFLGLMLTTLCFEGFVLDMENCLVTGIAKPLQLIESLKRYQKRKEYVPKILYEIFTLTSEFDAPRPDIIKMIIPVMHEHKQEASIQLAGTACLYNLTKGSMGEGVHPHILKNVVHSTLTAMSNFPNHPQLQKNALLTLCCDRILHEVTFDKYWCAKLVLDCLLSFNDNTTDRMAVAICSILAAKISTSQTALLGASNLYMLKLLRLVQSRMEDGVVDITLKFTLSALWNLTDESPATCEVFLTEKGLQLFMNLLESFPRDAAVETKVLGLLNNIAEVSRLRVALINKNFIAHLRRLLKSEQVEVSYFAAGIVAHLVCAGLDCWKDSGISRDILLKELGKVVLNWKQPEEEMVAYRSFQPFIPLLMAVDKPQVQLWAVWALHHVTTKNSTRYCPMMLREGVCDVLRRLIDNQGTNTDIDEQICILSGNIIKLLPEATSNPVTN